MTAAPVQTPATPETAAPAAAKRPTVHAVRHGLTGQVVVLSEDDSKRFLQHHAEVRDYYKPFGPIETALSEQIASGLWRLQRCAAIEEGLFAIAAGKATGNDIPGPARVWLEEGKPIQALSIYEARLRRALDKDKAELERLQTQRKQTAEQNMKQAVALHDLAKKEGRPYRPETYFSKDQPTPDSVFSTEAVAAESARKAAWLDAQKRLSGR